VLLHCSGSNMTSMPPLTPETGLGALLSAFTGAVNGDVFAAHLDQGFGPSPRAGRWWCSITCRVQ
jgi:hypothetical protein